MTAQNNDFTDISASTKDTLNHGHRSSPVVGTSSLQLQNDETPEVINLRQFIARQNATLDARRRHIEAIEQQIEEYERRVHNDRCVQDGYDYIQRAYDLSSYDNKENDDFVNGCRQIVTEDMIAVCYRQASDEIRRRVIDVETQLADIANDCRWITSVECDDGENSQQQDEFNRNVSCDVQEAQLVVDGRAQSRRALQLDALRLELAHADDIRHQQLMEHRRLSSAIKDVHWQLGDEARMFTTLDRSSLSLYVPSLSNTEKPFQRLEVKSKKFQTDECQRSLERDLHITRRFDADSQLNGSTVTTSTSTTHGTTLLNGCSRNRNNDMTCLLYTSPSPRD